METAFFQKSKQEKVMHGSFQLLFSDRRRTLKYLACILMGVPIWYSVGLLITLTPEIMKEQQIDYIKISTCFILFQTGITVGDLSSGIFSQYFKSRKKIIIAYMLFACLATILHFKSIYSGREIYFTSLLMGIGCGYLSVFVTTTAEHFGTNLRATVAATVTNFMRGAITILIPLHIWLEHSFHLTLTFSLIIVGIIVWTAALISVVALRETFGKDLDYLET